MNVTRPTGTIRIIINLQHIVPLFNRKQYFGNAYNTLYLLFSIRNHFSLNFSLEIISMKRKPLTIY